MKKSSLLLIVSFAGNILLFGNLVYKTGMKEKLGYINLEKVFYEFDYKKELELKLKKEKEKKDLAIDSLLSNLRALSVELERTKNPLEKDILYFRDQQFKFQQKKKDIEEENQALTDKFDSQIMEQMNQYIHDYGVANNYKFIFGSDGKGNIMYALENDELTADVISYINKKYKGLN